MIRFRIAAMGFVSSLLAIACVQSETNAPTDRGSLIASITGLPVGEDAAVTVTGPGDYRRTITSTTTLADLTPGTYVVSASDVTAAGHTYAPNRPSHTVIVAAGSPAARADVAYSIVTGGLAITIAGVPVGETAIVSVMGPSGYTQTLTRTDTMLGLEPGTYTVSASDVIAGGQIYGGTPGTQSVTVVAGLAPIAASVRYALSSGDLAIAIAGLPPGTAALVSVSGPGGFTKLLSTDTTLSGIRIGSYTVEPVEVLADGHTFGSPAGASTVEVSPGVRTEVSVVYSQLTGTLRVSIGGLPPTVDAIVTVTGPGGFTAALVASDSLVGVIGGTYQLSAGIVADGTDGYAPSPETQEIVVQPEGTATATVTYSFTGTISVNFTIDGLYLVQSTQRYEGTVPLIAGRDAYLRVFAKANIENTDAPRVRVRLYSFGTAVDSLLIEAGGTGVPTMISEGQLTTSWNALIPGSLIQDGLSVLAEVDPDDQVPEMDEGDNSFPVNGVPGAVDVRSLAPLSVRFVPVYTPTTGDTGNVSLGNTDRFMDQARRMFPMTTYGVDVRSVFTTSAPTLESDNGNDAWGTVLNEIRTLRNVTDQSDRYYYGVVRAPYGSGVAGIAYVPGSPSSTSKAAVGWDYLPSGSGVMAHELGHNFGRLHAPCGSVGGPDPNYPYQEASIGAWGMDIASLAVKDPATVKDLMSYCSPDWISDYTFEAVLDWHAASPTGQPSASVQTGPTLLVWGRITGEAIVLEPAFEVHAPAVLPAGPGPYQIEALAADGSSVFRLSFAGDLVADLPRGPERHFSYVIPLGEGTASRIETLRVSGLGMTATRQATTRAAGIRVARGLRAEATLSERTDLSWNAALHPMVLVRDPVNGEILSFARGGNVRIWTSRSALDVIVSDGVRSTAHRVTVLGR